MSSGKAEADPAHGVRFGGALRTSAFRMALVYCVAFTIGVGVLLGTIYLFTERIVSNEIDNGIQIELDALADEYDRDGRDGVVSELTRLQDRWGRSGAAYLLVDRSFARLAGNLAAWPFAGLPHGTWLEFGVARGQAGTVQPVRARVFTLPDGYLLVGSDVSQHRDFQHRFQQATWWAIGLTAVLGMLMGLWLSQRLLARVRAVSIECERILGGDLTRRLPVTGAGDEFDSLATAVNLVLARLDEQAGVLRATFESAAHDLRGPLFRLRGRLDERQLDPDVDEPTRASLERALSDIDAIQRTLGMLLQIAQAEAGTPLAESASVDLAALVTEIVSLYEPAARDQGLTLSSVVSPASVHGSRQLLTQLLVNLLENAIEHAGRGCAVNVHVESRARGARLVVADNGPGMPPHESERAQRPFVKRAAGSSAGSHLGLSLVASIARLHKGEVRLEDNAPGLRVVVDFD